MIKKTDDITLIIYRYRWECNCQKAIYIGKVRDWQQLTYLGIVRDSPTAAPIPPSPQALRISRNVSLFTLVDPKMVQSVRLGSDDPQVETLTTRPPILVGKVSCPRLLPTYSQRQYSCPAP